MTHGLHVLVRIALAAVIVLILARAAAWVRLRVRPDPAARLTPVAFHARTDDPQNLHDLLEPIRAKHKLPCLGAVVIRDGKVVAQGVTGVRVAGGSEAVTIDDRFHLGSDTKAMTATLLAMLVEDGTLRWDTTVGEVFDGSVKNIDPAWRAVTLEQLLRNRGGAPANLDAGGLWGRLWQRRGTPSQQRLELVEGVVTRPPAATADAKFIYSNAGFAIAGAMAEAKTGKSWESLITDRLFKPLGIQSAGFGAPGEAGKADQPRGHRANGQPIEPGPEGDNPPAIGPAGIAHMSLPDWARFVTLHLRGDRLNPAREARLLRAETFDTLHTPKDGYAMGWLVATRPWAKGDRPGDTGLVLNHAGSNTMWYCVAWLAPERDFAVIVATNQAGNEGPKGTDAAAAELIGEFLK